MCQAEIQHAEGLDDFIPMKKLCSSCMADAAGANFRGWGSPPRPTKRQCTDPVAFAAATADDATGPADGSTDAAGLLLCFAASSTGPNAKGGTSTPATAASSPPSSGAGAASAALSAEGLDFDDDDDFITKVSVVAFVLYHHQYFPMFV